MVITLMRSPAQVLTNEVWAKVNYSMGQSFWSSGAKLTEPKELQKYNPKISPLSVSSVEEALNILKYQPCDLVIAAYFLNGPETGLDLCHKINIHFPKTKCLLISGMSYYRFKELSRNVKILPEFMEKPISSISMKKYLSSFFEEIYF